MEENTNNEIISEKLTSLIRSIVRQEVDKILQTKIECTCKGKIAKINGDGTFNVYIYEKEKIIKNMKNESGKTLLVNDCVQVYYRQGSYSTGYIGLKC